MFLIYVYIPALGGVVLREAAPSCPEQHGVQAYAHPESCNLFFLCTNGTLTIEQCENGLLFDGKGAVHNHCNYNWAVECGERKADCKYFSCTNIHYSKFGRGHCILNDIFCIAIPTGYVKNF